MQDATYGNNPGRSDIIVRSKTAEDILRGAQREGYLTLASSNPEDIVKTVLPAEKKLGFQAMRSVSQAAGRGVPHYGVEYRPKCRGDVYLLESLKRVTIVLSYFYLFAEIFRPYRIYAFMLAKIPSSWLEYMNRKRQKYLFHYQLRNAFIDCTYVRNDERNVLVEKHQRIVEKCKHVHHDMFS
jgi:hypothetical protein